jgi:DNA-binding transcriptional regulator/RsmH inhibitor MraZ
LIAAGDGDTFQVWDGKKYETLTTEKYPNLMQS